MNLNRLNFGFGLSSLRLGTGPGGPSSGPSFTVLTDPDPASGTTTIIQGQHVHFRPQGVGLSFGVPDREVYERGAWLYRYSTNPTESALELTALDASARCPRGANETRGHYGVHRYQTPGVHTVVASVTYLGVTAVSNPITVTVTSADTHYVGTQTGCWAGSGGDYTGAPAGARTDFASLDAAFTWLFGASDRRLLLRRGGTYEITQTIASQRFSRKRQRLGAFGTGAKPVIRRASGFNQFDGNYTSNTWLNAVGTGMQTTWPLASGTQTALPALSAGQRWDVYLGNIRQTPGVHYDALTTGATQITFTTAPAAGVPVRVYRAPIALVNRVFFLIENNALNEQGEGTVIEDIRFQGDYNPETPSVYNPADLSTFDHDIGIICINPRNFVRHITIADCEHSGFRSFVAADGQDGDGRNILFWNNRCTSHYDYSVFTGSHRRICLIGNDFTQLLRTVNDNNGKTENVEGQANGADHGALRNGRCEETLIARNRMMAINSWAGDEGWQPVARLMQTGLPGQSLSAAENHTFAGAAGGWGGGPANSQTPIDPINELVACYNVMEWGVLSQQCLQSPHGYVYHDNLHVIATAPANGATIFDARDFDGFSLAAPPQPVVFNDTIYVGPDVRMTANLNLGRAATLQLAGATGVLATTTPTGSPTVVVFSFGVPEYSFGATPRFYETPDGGATWIEIGAGDNVVPTIEVLSENPPQQRFVLAGHWTAVMNGGNASGSTTVTFVTARTAGRAIRMCWNPTINGARTQFYPNNRATPITRPAPSFHNLSIVVDPAAVVPSIREVAGGAVVTPSVGPFDAFGRPQAGSPVLTAATAAPRSSFDLRGAAKSATIAGALAPATALTGWAAYLRPPAITAGWSQLEYPAGSTPNASADVVASITASGVPAIGLPDLSRRITIVRDGVQAAPPTQVDDILRAVVWTGHPSTGRLESVLPPRIVSPATFANQWISNGGAAAMVLTGPSAPASTGPIHIPMRLHVNATAAAVTRILYSLAGLRLSLPTNNRPNFSANAISLFTSDASRQIGVGAANAVSFLWSIWPSQSGPGGITSRLIWNNGTPVTTSVAIGSNIVWTSTRFLALAINSQTVSGTGTASECPNLSIDSWLGVFEGGDPTFGTFFNTANSNAVRAPGEVSSPGMTPLFLFSRPLGLNGVPPENTPLSVGTASPSLYGSPLRTAATFTAA